MMCGVCEMRTKAEIREDDAEDYIYEIVNSHSDFSIHDLSEILGWSTDKVSHAIKKLEEDSLIEKDRSVEEERTQAKNRPIGWDRPLSDDAMKDNAIGKFLWWLLKKGYAQQTATSYDEDMRRAEREHLTIKSVNDIYLGSSQGKRTRLRHAVRLLDEYYDE